MLRRCFLALGVVVLMLSTGSRSTMAAPQAQSTGNAIQCVSNGANGFGGGSYASISRNGRLVFFESLASDLVAGHVEDSWDTFMFDRARGTHERISTRSDGTPVYNSGVYTSPPAISPDGRFVAFVSGASGLVSGDRNGVPDVFLRDRASNTTVIVSVDASGGNSNGPSFSPAVSGNGRYVAFQSMASDLVSGDTNEMMDVFVRDMQEGTTRRISVHPNGRQGSESREYGFHGVTISEGGRYVAFTYEYLPFSEQPGMVGPSVYLYDNTLRQTRWMAIGSMPSLSADGRRLAFVSTEMLSSADMNDSADVYVWDQASPSRFNRVSIPRNGGEITTQDIFSPPDISDDGRYVAFESNAQLVPGIPAGTSNIYLRDTALQTTQLVSRALNGGPADGDSRNPVISGGGTAVAFSSDATNLIASDDNNVSDVFVFTRTPASVLPGTREYYLPYVR